MSLSNSSSTLPRKSLAQINATTASTMRSRGMSNDVNQPIAPVAPTFIPAPVSTPKEEHLENVKRLKLLVTNWFLQVCLRGKLPLERVKDLTMLYDELRDGNLLCRLLNVLHPNAITQINEAVGTISALENLSKFSGGCAAHYGVDRKYMFRPLDFFNALTKGDEGMTIFLAALAIHAVEKGYTVNFPVPEAKDLLDTIIKESESNYHLKGPIAKSSGDLLAGTNSVDNLLSSKHANRNSRNSSNAPENKNISSFRGQSTGNLLAGSAASPRDSTTSNTARRPSAIKDMVNMITGSSSPNLANRMSMSPVASPAATLTTPLTASSSIASPNSQATFTVDAAVVLPKLQKKLRKLNYNQKIILERFETALTKHNQTISQNMTQNYEQIVRKLMYAESSQKDFSEVLIDLLFQNTGINLDSNPDDLKKALEDQPDRGSIISVAPVSPPQKQFGKLPPEVLNAGLAKPEMMRLAVVYEMIDTEVDFGKDMSTLISFHKVQFKLLKLLSDDDITRVFSNTEELVSVSQSFSDKMNARKTANPFIEEIGDIIAEVSDSLKAYSIYCGNYPTAMQMVSNLQSNQEVKDQIQKWMSVPETRGLSLESFLIKPIQRICKYPLLLKELLKHTEKTHKDYANLLLAAEKIEAVVKVANEATRLLGERDRIAGIQNKIDATPKLYKDANSVFSRQNKKSNDRYLILCGDIFIVCKVINKRYTPENIFYISDMVIKDKASKSGKFHLLSVSTGIEKKEYFTIHCISEDERTRWIDAFSDAIKANPPVADRRRSQSQTSSSSKKENRKSMGAFKNFAGKRMTGTYDTSEIFEEVAFVVNTDEKYPECVECDGQILKRAVAATGSLNVATKESQWKLSDNFVLLDSKTMKPKNEVKEEEEDEEDYDPSQVEVINDNWRRVIPDDSSKPYFFNIQTQESSWVYPVM